RPHHGVYRTARPVRCSAAAQAAGTQNRRSAMKTFLSILLVAATARAQIPETPASRAPRMEEPGPSTAGRGRATAPAPASTLSPKDLKYPPLHTIQAPVAATFILPNGMKVSLLEDHDLPLVSGIAVVRTGSLLDPPQRTGLAQLAGTAVRTGGTTAKTGNQIDNLLENAAATVESAISESAGIFSFAVSKAGAPAIMQVFQEMLTQPGFRREKGRCRQGRVAFRRLAPQRQCREPRPPRIRQPDLRQGFARRAAAGIRHNRPHLPRRPARVPQAILLSGQRHARRLGRFQYRRDAGFNRKALCRLDRAA